MERQDPLDPQPPDVYVPPAPYPPQPIEQSSSVQTTGGYTTQTQSQLSYDQGMLVQHDMRTVQDKNARRRALVMRINGVIYGLLGLLETLLVTRFFLRLFNANPFNDFVDFIYGLSSWFIRPFNGIFEDQALDQGGVVEWSTLVAMLVYMVAAIALAKLVSLIFSPIETYEQTYTSVQRRRM